MLEGIGIMIFSSMDVLFWAIVTMLIFALFLKMSNGATYAVVPFINKKAMGAVAGIVGAGRNVGAVLAGFLFTSNDISYRESLFTIGIAVTVVSVISLLLGTLKVQESVPHTQPLPFRTSNRLKPRQKRPNLKKYPETNQINWRDYKVMLPKKVPFERRNSARGQLFSSKTKRTNLWIRKNTHHF